ncbi:MAG: hypothetical protein V4684_02785 [Pseudomonadota bacterium]
MFYPDQAGSPAAVRLTVNTPKASTGWGVKMLRAGWRCFMAASGKDGCTITCILKRGATCIMFTQNTLLPLEQTVMLPPAEAGELCSLFVESGLAVPA